MNTRVDWDQLASVFSSTVAASVESQLDLARAFAEGRLQEGREVGEWIAGYLQRPLRFLDVGAGNGGVAFGVGNIATHEVHALDIIPNSEGWAWEPLAQVHAQLTAAIQEATI